MFNDGETGLCLPLESLHQSKGLLDGLLLSLEARVLETPSRPFASPTYIISHDASTKIEVIDVT
jgi:hypothetical protein